MSSNKSKQKGDQGESEAQRFLEQKGLALIQKNYRCKQGEIDLIMQDGTYTVFVEVRLRHNPDYGHSIETITKTKQRRVKQAATCYLLEKKLYDQVDCRFDAVGIGPNNAISWVPNAF